MKNHELQARLALLPPDIEVMILDGFNGGGDPRTINLGPTHRSITHLNISNNCDCEEMDEGQEVVVLGYGSY